MAKNKNTFTLGALTIKSNGPKKPLVISVGGKSVDVPYKDLWGVVYFLGSRKHKDELIPVQKKEMMTFSRKYTIEAKHDIKAGEHIVFWGEIDVPRTVVESIALKEGAKVIELAPTMP